MEFNKLNDLVDKSYFLKIMRAANLNSNEAELLKKINERNLLFAKSLINFEPKHIELSQICDIVKLHSSYAQRVSKAIFFGG